MKLNKIEKGIEDLIISKYGVIEQVGKGTYQWKEKFYRIKKESDHCFLDESFNSKKEVIEEVKKYLNYKTPLDVIKSKISKFFFKISLKFK